MDRAPGRTRVHEHAETGQPLAAYKLHRTHGRIGKSNPRFHRATLLCKRQWWNGPAGISGKVGHKISANGLPYRTTYSVCTACLVCTARPSPRIAALRGRTWRGNRHTSDLRVIPSAHPLPFRPCASPSNLAAGPSRLTPLGGKVRWQRKFVSPARRTKRGLQFLKTINSRKFITNAKTSTPSPGRFTTAASHASCQACSPPLWTLAWSATPSSM